MRRGCSVVLFVLGAWLLSCIGIVGMFPADEQIPTWVFTAIFIGFAAPFLLVGAWMSPGKRWVELGLTLMISAGLALFMVLAMLAFTTDKAIQRFMPQPMPPFDFTSPAMILSILVVGGGGYLLWRAGRRN